MLTPQEKSPLLEKFYSEEDRTHDAASSRIVSPTHYQRAILVPWGCWHPDQPVCLVHNNVSSLTSWMFPEGADILTNRFVWSTTICPLWHPGCITVDLFSDSLFFTRQLPPPPKTFCHFVQKLQQTPLMVTPRCQVNGNQNREACRHWYCTRWSQTQAACQFSSNRYGTRQWQTQANCQFSSKRNGAFPIQGPLAEAPIASKLLLLHLPPFTTHSHATRIMRSTATE